MRAMTIVAEGRILAVSENLYYVASQRDNGSHYRVEMPNPYLIPDFGTCTCADYRRGMLCKHLAACTIYANAIVQVDRRANKLRIGYHQAVDRIAEQLADEQKGQGRHTQLMTLSILLVAAQDLANQQKLSLLFTGTTNRERTNALPTWQQPLRERRIPYELARATVRYAQ